MSDDDMPPRRTSVEGTPLKACEERAAVVRLALAQAMPYGQAGPSNTDIMNKLESLMGAVALQEDLRVSQVETLESMRAVVADELTPILTELGAIKEHGVSKSDVKDVVEPMKDQIAKLQLQVQSLERGSSSLRTSSRNDPAHLRLAFTGFTDESLDRRVALLTGFMKAHIPGERFATIDTAMSGPRDNRKAANVSFVQFHTEAARDRALELVKAKSAELKNDSGGNLRIERARTEAQRERNWVMRKAEEILKDSLKGQDPDIKYHVAKGQRKLTANGQDAFVQPNGERGRFVGSYAPLQVPP